MPSTTTHPKHRVSSQSITVHYLFTPFIIFSFSVCESGCWFLYLWLVRYCIIYQPVVVHTHNRVYTRSWITLFILHRSSRMRPNVWWHTIVRTPQRIRLDLPCVLRQQRSGSLRTFAIVNRQDWPWYFSWMGTGNSLLGILVSTCSKYRHQPGTQSI